MVVVFVLMAHLGWSSAFTAPHPYRRSIVVLRQAPSARVQHPLFSSWDNFAYDDDDDLLEVGPDEGFVAADENDDPAIKAATGMSLEAPYVDYDGPVIQVPAGKSCEFKGSTVTSDH